MHSNVPKTDTVVYWAIERVKKIRRGRVSRRQPGVYKNLCHFWFPPLLWWDVKTKPLFPILKKKLCCLLCQNIPPKPLQDPLVLPSLALKSCLICTRAGLPAVSLSQAHPHSPALISNCFFSLFLYACSKTENEGESEREKAKVCVKGESRWLLPHPLCVPRPPCWQTTYNVCLQSPLWSRRKGQHTATGRKGLCVCVWGGVPGEDWHLGEARVGWGSRPSSPGRSRGSHLCLLLLLGHKKWVYAWPTGLCADAISSLGSRPTAPRASESPQSGGDLLFLGTVSSHSSSPGGPGRGSKHTLTRFRGKGSEKANPQRWNTLPSSWDFIRGNS